MSTLQQSDNVILNNEQRETAFLFNSINTYDLFILSVYPNYYRHVNISSDEDQTIDFLKTITEECKDKNTCKITQTQFNTQITEAVKNKPETVFQVDIHNVDFIMEAIGLKRALKKMKTAMTAGLKVGEEEKVYKDTKGIKNKFNNDKYNTLEKFSIRLAVFILSMVHDLYWDKFTVDSDVNEKVYDNIDNQKSEIPLKECFEFCVPVSQELMQLYMQMLDEKYPTSLSIKNQTVDFKKDKLENQTMLNDGIRIGKGLIKESSNKHESSTAVSRNPSKSERKKKKPD